MIYMEGAAFVATFLEPFSSFFSLDLTKMASKTPPSLASLLLRAALARLILIMVMTELSYAFIGCLHFIICSVLEL